MSALLLIATIKAGLLHFRFVPILLQKSKIVEPLIFRENTNRQMIADSIALSCVAEVACEFNA
jgi:hypothetical protein